MSIKKDSLLGKIFEAGFKVGFVSCLTDNKITKYKDKLQAYKEIIIKGEFGFISKVFEKELVIAKPYAKDYKESLLNRVKSLGFSVDIQGLHELTAYSIGCWEGYLYCNQIIKDKDFKDIHLIYFDINSEVPFKGYAENSDLLLYIEDSKGNLHLYLYDLKFMFGRTFVEKFLSKSYIPIQENYTIPPVVKGYPLAISIGNSDFLNFVSSFVSILEAKNSYAEYELVLDIDLKNMLQVMSYLMDYLKKSNEVNKIRSVNFGIISGISDGLSYKFLLEENWYDRQKVDSLAEKIRSLYEIAGVKIYSATAEIRNKNISEDLLLDHFLDTGIKKLESEIQSLKEEIKKRDDRTYLIPISNDIDHIRKGVRNIVSDFWKKFTDNEKGEGIVLSLLHSTGAGKTTASREVILGQTDQPVVYLYFAPRRKLILQEYERIKSTVSDESIIIHLPDRSQRNINKNYRKIVDGASHKNQNSYGEKGNLHEVIEQVIHSLKEQKEDKRHIAALTTTQSIVKVSNNERFKHDTYKHIEKLKPHLEMSRYKCVIVLDELSGSDNGLYSLIKLLNIVEKSPDLFTVLVFDANLHSKSMFEAVLKEFVTNSYVSPSISLSRFEKDGIINYKDKINIHVFSDYSFPAKEVILREKFFFENTQKKELVLKEIADYLTQNHLKKMKEKNERMYVYIQDKEAVNIFQSLLSEKGLKAEYFTSNYDSADGSHINQDTDVVISTSTLSRGIDLYNNFTKVCIINTHFFSPESNFGEELQACARIRGIKDSNGNNIDRLITKEIIRIVIARESDDEIKQAITDSLYTQIKEDSPKIISIDKQKLSQYIELWMKRQSLKDSLIYADIGRSVFESYFNPYSLNYITVPVSSQRSPVYIPSQELELESLISFVNDLLKVEKIKEDETFKKGLHAIYHILVGLINITSINNFNINNIESFYPPYCLTNHEIISQLNRENGEKLIKIMNSEFKEKLRQINPEKTAQMEEFIEKLLSISKIQFPCILYIPVVAMLYETAEEKYRFESITVRNYISRANIKTAFSYNNHKRQFVAERIPDRKSIIAIAFPVELQENFGWISGDYPKLSGELFYEIIKKKMEERRWIQS